MGKGSTGDERDAAKALALSTDQDPTIVYEGQERPIFWNLLGGEGDYINERIFKEDAGLAQPRLFHGSNATGNFKSTS